MTLFEGLQTYLMGDSALAAKLPGGMKPQDMPQANAVPMATVRIVSAVGEPPTHDSGASPWASTRIEITIWGTDFLNSEQTALYITNKMFTVNGFLGGGSNCRFATQRILGPRSVSDEPTRLVGAQVDIIGMLNRATLS